MSPGSIAGCNWPQFTHSGTSALKHDGISTPFQTPPAAHTTRATGGTASTYNAHHRRCSHWQSGFAGVRPTPARRQRIAAVSAAQQERIAEQYWPATPLAVSSKIKTHHRLHPSLSQSKISHAPTQHAAPKITPAIIAATPDRDLPVFVAAIATADSRDDGMSPSTTR